MAAGVIQGFFIGGGFKGRRDGSHALDPRLIGLARHGGKPLPAALLAKMEAAFGADFSRVRVHEGPQAGRIGALAFTMGEQLYFAPGQFQPDTARGRQLIGHELAHVIQQRQGRARAASAGLAVLQDRALEAEADRLSLRAAATTSRPGIAVQRSATVATATKMASAGAAAVAANAAAAAAPAGGVPVAAAAAVRPVATWHDQLHAFPLMRRFLPRPVRIDQRTSLAWVNDDAFRWVTSFSVAGEGDRSGAIIQECGHLFGTGERAGQNVQDRWHFYEFFPVTAAGRTQSDEFSTNLSRGRSDYCLLAGKLYYIRASHPQFGLLQSCFGRDKPGVPPAIDMDACGILAPGLLHAIGRPLAERSAFFIRGGRGRRRRLVIRNTTEGLLERIPEF